MQHSERIPDYVKNMTRKVFALTLLVLDRFKGTQYKNNFFVKVTLKMVSFQGATGNDIFCSAVLALTTVVTCQDLGIRRLSGKPQVTQ